MPTKPSAADAAAAHPLKGIVNTNDDPNSCALCSDTFPLVGSVQDYCCHVAHCCGKMFCVGCIRRIIAVGSEYKCVMCGHPNCRNPFTLGQNNSMIIMNESRDLIGMMKKNAKKDLPWSQYQLGRVLCQSQLSGRPLTGATRDATKLLRKAARKNHPAALFALGLCWRDGHGCNQNLEEAKRCVEESMSLDYDCRLATEGKQLLVSIAKEYKSKKSPEALESAKEILESVARENIDTSFTTSFAKDVLYARYQMGNLAANQEGNYKTALEWFSSAYFAHVELEFEDGKRCTPAYSAMLCCQRLNLAACAKFWMASAKIMSSALNINDRMERVQEMVALSRTLRSIRDTCSGCGAMFEGEERKFCRGCRAVCYCSRDCQKMHWNRKNDGHREDCKAATELKRKLKEARKKAATGVATEAAYSL